MYWFLCDRNLRHERVNDLKKEGSDILNSANRYVENWDLQVHPECKMLHHVNNLKQINLVNVDADYNQNVTVISHMSAENIFDWVSELSDA